MHIIQTPLFDFEAFIRTKNNDRLVIVLEALDAVYFEAKKSKTIVVVRPKPPFRPIFQVAASKADAEIRIINEPLDILPKGSPVFLVETGEGWNQPTHSLTELVNRRKALVVSYCGRL